MPGHTQPQDQTCGKTTDRHGMALGSPMIKAWSQDRNGRLSAGQIPKTLNCFNHSWFCCLEYYMYKSVCMRCTEEKLLLHAYVYSNLFNSKYVFIQTNYAYMYIYILISHITTHKRNFKSIWKTFLRNGVFVS